MLMLVLCACRYSWRRYGPCNATCHTPGQPAPRRFRDIVCLFNNVKIVSDSYCDDLLILVPINSIECNTLTCNQYAFRLGEWSACNTTCGYGIRTRTVDCVGPDGIEALHRTLAFRLRHSVAIYCQLLLFCDQSICEKAWRSHKRGA